MRRRIAAEGALVVVLGPGREVAIESFGLPLEEDMPDFIEEAKADVIAALGKLRGKKAGAEHISEAARLAARRAARRWSGKNPQVKVVMVGG